MAEEQKVDIVISAVDKASGPIEKISGGISGMASGAKTAAVAVGKAALAAGAAATAFAAASVVKFSQVGDAVEKMSKRTGLAAESVSALRVAADASGTSIEAVEGGLRKMQKGLLDGDGGVLKLGESLKALGITLSKDILDKKPEAQFEEIGNAIAKLETPAQRSQAAMIAFGISGTQLLPIFEDGAFSMAEWDAKAKELGLSFDDLAAAKAAKLNDALGYLKGAFLGVALTVGEALAPIVTEMVDRLIPMITQALTFLWNQIEIYLVPAWNRLTAAVEANRPELEILAKLVGGAVIIALKAAIIVIAAVIDVFAIMIGWIGKGVDAWVNFKENVISLWKDIQVKAGEIWDGIKKKILDVINAVTEPIRKFLEKVESVKNAVGGVVSSIGAGLGFGGARAEGGPVSAGKAYLVGEEGPELFVPGRAGGVVPNGAGGGITIHIHNPMILSKEDVVEKLGDPIIDVLKQHLAI